MADPDWDDPCAIVAWLKPQLFKVAAGQQTVMVRHGDEQWQFSQANYSQLQQLYAQQVSECAAKNGTRVGRRRAFTAG